MNWHTTKVVEVGPIGPSTSPHIIGDVRIITLACGHTISGNPAMAWSVGSPARCYHPDHAA